jgi:hypothetical protein
MKDQHLALDDEWLRSHFRADARLDFQPLRSNDWLTDGIWRATDGAKSVIVKTVSARRRRHDDTWAAHWTYRNDDQTHWNYWRREYLVYRSEIPSLFAQARVLAPALLHAVESPGTVTMFLEDCALVPATLWGVTSYCAAARDLGLAHGDLSARGGAGSRPWFCVNYVRDYALEKPFDRTLVTADESWAGLVDVGVATPYSRDQQIRFALNEQRLLSLLNLAPSTLCHNDFWTRNLFGDARQPTAVIDWAFVGSGPMGSDIANMVASAGFDAFVPAEHLASFSEQVFSAYLGGLRQGGWKGDQRTVRLGYLASASKYAWVVAAMLMSSITPGHPIYVGYGRGGELDFPSVAATLDMLAAWSDGALALADSL